MNYQNTGLLIAKRRRELGLTQKELSDILNISDRTVSKWERGVGFPDISLVEPLADTLGITINELIHGEEQANVQTPEQTAVDVVQALCPVIKAQRKRLKTVIGIISAILIIITLSFAMLLIFSRDLVGDETGIIQISAAEATEICPYILITKQDTDLLNKLCQDPRVQLAMKEEPHYTHGADLIAEYMPLIDNFDMELTYCIIQTSHRYIHVEYGTELTRIHLDLDTLKGKTEKGIRQLNSPLIFLEDGTFDFSTTPDDVYTVYNIDNSYFERKTYNTGLAALFDKIHEKMPKNTRLKAGVLLLKSRFCSDSL